MTQRKSHDERRREIAETALSLAAGQGVGTVTTQAIADAMGVSQGTVFRHFANRDEIFHEAVAVVKARVFVRLSPVFADKSTSGAVRLENLVRAHLGVIQDNRGVPALLFSDRLHQDDPKLKAEVRQMMKAYAGRVAGLIIEGVEDGSIKPDVDPALLAQTVVTMIQGVVLRHLAGMKITDES
ncbi:TetR/AcrR family transcriptional regulator, partial [Pseudomonadota bacterium]